MLEEIVVGSFQELKRNKKTSIVSFNQLHRLILSIMPIIFGHLSICIIIVIIIIVTLLWLIFLQIQSTQSHFEKREDNIPYQTSSIDDLIPIICKLSLVIFPSKLFIFALSPLPFQLLFLLLNVSIINLSKQQVLTSTELAVSLLV